MFDFDSEKLKQELLMMEPRLFYFKHIVKSHNWYFSEYLNIPPEELIDKTDYFKEIVSTHFKINFHNVQIIGSAKTGYSLSPQKLLKPFHESNEKLKLQSSDIDIAIISNKLYNFYWDKLRQVRRMRTIHYYNRIVSSIFRGFINDKDLLNISETKDTWMKVMNPVNIELQDNLGFIHPITYRLYRSWTDLEEYQIDSITEAKKRLEMV